MSLLWCTIHTAVKAGRRVKAKLTPALAQLVLQFGPTHKNASAGHNPEAEEKGLILQCTGAVPMGCGRACYCMHRI